MKLLILCTLVAGISFWLTACSSVAISDYSQNTPQFKPEEFFNGQLTAHGVVKNRSGKVTRYFVADIKGHWENGRGELKEEFLFNDGEIQHRTWVMTLDANNQLIATANDVVGESRGQFAGNSLKLDYKLNIKYKDSDLLLNVKDWMWLIDKNTLLNESVFTKWGFKVGSVQLVIKRKE